MKGFYISVKNDLLEAKHVQQMGEAVWLYMWLLDKMTSVNENGVGKVLNNSAITYGMVYDDLGISMRTYQRWIKRLRVSKYINTTQAKHGLVILILKAKKNFGKQSSPATYGTAKPKKSNQAVPYVARATTNMAQLDDKYGTALYIDDNTVDISIDNINTADLSPGAFRELVSKLYYQAIKSLDVPKTNNDNIRKRIADMASDPDRQKIVNYLTFIRDQYRDLDWKYKPIITTALQICDKRAAVRETFARHVKSNRGVTVI